MKTSDPNVLIKTIKALTDKKIKQIEYATKANAEELASLAKRNAPKDLGKLAQSIQNFEDTISKNIGTKYRVVVTEKYGAYVEFGTGDRVEVPDGLTDWAMQFYVNGQGHTPAQPFLYPAFKQIKKQYLADLKDIVNGK